jgi:hypothetical protein
MRARRKCEPSHRADEPHAAPPIPQTTPTPAMPSEYQPPRGNKRFRPHVRASEARYRTRGGHSRTLAQPNGHSPGVLEAGDVDLGANSVSRPDLKLEEPPVDI